MKTWPIMLSITVSLLGGCSTTTTVHYDLKSPTAVKAINDHPTVMPYQIANVNVPAALDVSTLIVRQPDNSLMVLSHDKWVAPLSEVALGALSSTLTQSLGSPPMPVNMLASSVGSSTDTTQIFVDLQQFEMQPAKQASVGALWQIAFAGARPQSITCYSTLTQTVNPGVAALVAAQQLNLQRLGQQIAMTLKTAKAPAGINCRQTKR